jgi:hypothetical protein
MQMRKLAAIGLPAACAILRGVLWAGLSGPVTVGVAERQADIIVVATLESVTPQSQSLVNAQLRVIRVVKGGSLGPLLAADLVPSPMMRTNALRLQDLAPQRLIGATGLWFIKKSAGTYHLLPLATGDFVWGDVPLRLESPELPAPDAVIPGLAGSVNPTGRLVLAALVHSYLSSATPRGTLRDLVAASLNDKEDRQDSLAAAKVLIASSSPDHQILGLAAALRLGSDEALPLLAEKAPALQSHQMFPSLVFALSTEYKPNGEASIAPLRQLAAQHMGGVNFDAAVAAALRKIGTKAVVPALVELLDSQDPTAQLHAAHFLSEYALFADANGNIPAPTGPGHVAGPWGTEATQAHMPSRDSTMTAQEYAAFWKSWWAENKTKLGFPGP